MAYGAAAVILIWAAATRVRRRAVAAACVAVATSILILFAAAADNAPDNAFFWLVAVGVGFSVMAVAGVVEAYRSRRGHVMERFDRLMEGWQ